MAHTTKVPLGAPTLVRKWYLDVNTNTYESPTWTGVFGVSNFKPSMDYVEGDASDFDSKGWKSSSVDALGWSVELTVERKVTVADGTAYDTGQEALRAVSKLFGTSNRVDIRFYEVTTSGPTEEAYRGYASVKWEPAGGGMAEEDRVSVTLTGQGALTAVTHPDGAPDAVPTIGSLTPYTDVEAGGAIVQIAGNGFTGTITDGVVFGAATCDFVVVNDNLIIAVAPAQSAATVEVTVENAIGESTVNQNFIYTVAP